MATVIRGDPVVPGSAQGIALAGEEPLSFWGGYDQNTGEIIDRRHDLAGHIARHRILAIPCTRGSSTTTAVLLEAVRQDNAPAALLTIGVDMFLSLASVVADELFGRTLPVVALTPEDFARIRTGEVLRVTPDGLVYRPD